jgi:hypothetical protein
MTKENSPHPKVILAFGDTEAIYTELTSPLSMSLASWFAIKNDMDFVVRALSLLMEKTENSEEENENIYLLLEGDKKDNHHIYNTALYRAAIVTYAKVFSSAKGRKQKLNVNIFKEEELKSLHKELYDERNSYHAHAGDSQNESLVPVIVFQKDKKIKNQLSTVSFNVIYKNKTKLNEYIKLAKYVTNYAEKKANECGNLVYKMEIENNIDDLYKKAERQSKN